MKDYVFTRENGLQPTVFGLNVGISEANGNPLVIIDQTKPKTVTVSDKNGNEYIEVSRVLYAKTLQMKNFLDFDTLIVGKRTDIDFTNVPFDLVNDKWRIKGLSGHKLNNTVFNIYDRPKVLAIINYFVTKNQQTIHDLLYVEVRKADGKERFLNILKTVIELKDDFHILLSPVVDFFNVPYQEPVIETQKKEIVPTPVNDGTLPVISKTTIEAQTSSNKYGTLILLVVAVIVAKKKKWL